MTVKLCKNCVHYNDNSYLKCWLPSRRLDLVKGEPIYDKEVPNFRRNNLNDPCGPDGKMWKQRPPKFKRLRKVSQSLVQSVHKFFGTWVAKTKDASLWASVTEGTVFTLLLVLISHSMFSLALSVLLVGPPLFYTLFFSVLLMGSIVTNILTAGFFLEELKGTRT